MEDPNQVLKSMRVVTSFALCALLFTTTLDTGAQNFVRMTDSAINNMTGPAGYTGASWIDADNDGDLDLFVNHSTLFRNDGGDEFVSVATNIGDGIALQTGNGNTWADYDNDGDNDVVVCSGETILYRNEGDLNFVAQSSGDLTDPSAARGWSCSFADYNNDGYLDLAVTHPAGFVPPTGTRTTNHLFQNSGPPEYIFTRDNGTIITTGFAAYTVGTWSDFDLDGDQDFHVGAGPANGTLARDYIYRNLLTQTGTATFERVTEAPIGTQLQDGQVWNWADYDNDGDMDATLTNWGGSSGGLANRLYRNDGGTFTEITDVQFSSIADVSLGQVWADFDNDGDQDIYIGNDSNGHGRLFKNSNGSLESNTTHAPEALGTRRGMAAGDYNGDGKIDLVTVGPGNNMQLYRNDLFNPGAYLKVKLEGVMSNRSGIGAKVRATANIAGTITTQLRELQSQTNFNSQNAMEIHFGLRNATVVDRLEIEWPSGTVDLLTDVAVNQTLELVEGQNVGNESVVPNQIAIQIESIFPHPIQGEGHIVVRTYQSGVLSGRLIDLLGRTKRVLFQEKIGPGRRVARFDVEGIANGVYRLELAINDVRNSQMIVVAR